MISKITTVVYDGAIQILLLQSVENLTKKIHIVISFQFNHQKSSVITQISWSEVCHKSTYVASRILWYIKSKTKMWLLWWHKTIKRTLCEHTSSKYNFVKMTHLFNHASYRSQSSSGCGIMIFHIVLYLILANIAACQNGYGDESMYNSGLQYRYLICVS